MHPGRVSWKATPQSEGAQTFTAHSELMRLVLDRVTAMAGENVTKTILHQIGREIGWTAFHHSRSQTAPPTLTTGLDEALRLHGFGKLVDLHEIDHRTNVTYTCTIETKGSNCDLIRGIVSRWLESHLQEKALNIEGPCSSQGQHICVFRITFRK